jgi:hypothetical protein
MCAVDLPRNHSKNPFAHCDVHSDAHVAVLAYQIDSIAPRSLLLCSARRSFVSNKVIALILLLLYGIQQMPKKPDQETTGGIKKSGSRGIPDQVAPCTLWGASHAPKETMTKGYNK